MFPTFITLFTTNVAFSGEAAWRGAMGLLQARVARPGALRCDPLADMMIKVIIIVSVNVEGSVFCILFRLPFCDTALELKDKAFNVL